jgi:hypothetical protein
LQLLAHHLVPACHGAARARAISLNLELISRSTFIVSFSFFRCYGWTKDFTGFALLSKFSFLNIAVRLFPLPMILPDIRCASLVNAMNWGQPRNANPEKPRFVSACEAAAGTK